MNFFERQYRARRATGRLIALFLAAVLLIVVTINLVVYFAFNLTQTEAGPVRVSQWLEEPYWLWVSAAVLAVVIVGTLVSFVKLARGGEAVAEMVGARRIDMASADPSERKLINVVEEMSIASGTPVPRLYVMDEEHAINAFVAGYKPSEAVLVVTKGSLDNLSRDELQGVVGHEYSHVMNGDMRINVRLISILAGILLIGQLGGYAMRSMRFSGRSSRDGAQAQIAIFAIGLALFVVGYIGVLFGNLIKAAISRQREYLADASAVQFTRNPDGIAGALWKIKSVMLGERPLGSRLLSSHADDMSHMCFGESLRFAFSSLFSTHPPLDERIAAIDPQFLTRVKWAQAERRPAPAAPAQPASAGPGAAAAMGFAAGAAVSTSSRAVAESVGNPSARHFDYAHRLHATLPAALLDAAHTPAGARHTVYALILAGTNERSLEVANALIKAHEGEAAPGAVEALREPLARLGPPGRLPLLDIALPTLKGLPVDARARFLGAAQALIKVDRRFTLFEFALYTILKRSLAPDAMRADRIAYHRAGQVMGEIRSLLSAFARAGAKSAEEEAGAFSKVIRYFVSEPMAPDPRISPDELAAALEKLARVSPLVKRTVLEACADCVLHDGKIMPVEAELLRATALSLDCPMPPLVES